MDIKELNTLAKGDVVINKTNMWKAEVAAVSQKPEGNVVSIAYEDVEHPGRTAKLGYIAPENAVCFSFVEHTKQAAPVPEAYVMGDGTAVINGRGVDSGDVRFSEVLFTLPGHVVLLTERDETGSMDVMYCIVGYNGVHCIIRRKFATIPYGSSLRKFTVGKACFLYEERREIRERALEDGRSECRGYFCSANLYCLTVQDGELVIYINTASHPLMDGEGGIIGSQLAPDGIPTMLAFASGEDVDPDTGEVFTAAMEHVIIFRGTIHGCLIEDRKVAVEGDNPEVVQTLDGLTIRTDKEILVEDVSNFIRISDKDIVTKLAKHPYLVSVEIIRRRFHYILTFADESLQTVTVEVTEAHTITGNSWHSVWQAVLRG